MTDTQKLEPCPFCGGEAEIERFGDRWHSTIYRCTMCGCSLETGEEWGHGRAWNRRAPASPWRPIAEAPRDGTQCILMWNDYPSLRPHWELGWWNASKGWVNTYCRPFGGGEPTHFMIPVLPAPPQEPSHD